jgi:hypothetical protein
MINSGRSFCLLHDKPMTLRPWIEVPTIPSVFDAERVMTGFVRLVTLFRGVDLDISGCWTTAGFVTPVTLSLATLSGHDYDGAGELRPMQTLDLAITREWLRAKTWKLGIPQGRSSEFVASGNSPVWRLDEPLIIGQSLLENLHGTQGTLEELWSSIVVCAGRETHELRLTSNRITSCATYASVCTTSCRSCRRGDELERSNSISSSGAF